jgi:hypothetical protein
VGSPSCCCGTPPANVPPRNPVPADIKFPTPTFLAKLDPASNKLKLALKGLILSNIKALQSAENMNYEWYCILEDDAEIDINIYKELQQFINCPENKNMDVIFLDKRRAAGSSGNLFNAKVISKLIEDLHPLSFFSITMEEKYNLAPLWDWKLWCYVQNNNIKYGFLPCIGSGQFPSTISI